MRTGNMTLNAALALAALVALTLAPLAGLQDAEARRGGGGFKVKSSAHHSVRASTGHAVRRRGAAAEMGGRRDVRVDRDVRRTTRIDRDLRVERNINIDRDIDIDIDHDYHHHYDHWDGGDFIAGAVTGAVVGAAVGAATRPSTVVVGTVYNTLPSGCVALSAGIGTYYECGSVYYQPRYQGSSVVYVAIDRPL